VRARPLGGAVRGEAGRLKQAEKTLVQCDFDGTVTVEDISVLLLDAFGDSDWRRWEKEYQEGRISVGRFNSLVFGTVRADGATMLEYARQKAVIRPGFAEFVGMCRRSGFRLVIVSNGLQFYIEQLLKDIGMAEIEMHAARTRFFPNGLRVEYVGPDGNAVDSGFKDAYAHMFLADGYRVVYIGDGRSDLAPASLCHQVFAAADTGSLLSLCRETGVECRPFSSFHDIVRAIESR